MSGEGAIKCGLGVGVAVLVLIIALIVASFSDCEYYEYAFKKRKSTGSVDLGKVYSGGRHFVGPDYTMKVFPASAHVVELNDVAIFTNERLEVRITVNFLYFLRKHELPLLHKAYDIGYEHILKKNALDALKVAASGFSTREYVLERARVEAVLRKAVTDRLGGKCCELDCEKSEEGCVKGCKSRGSCTESDKGFFARVGYFYLEDLGIPPSVQERFLKALVLNEETETEQFTQDAQIVQKQTDQMVKAITNTATEIAQNATAQSELILAQARANATATVEAARSEGLRLLYGRLGISTQEHKSSFDYLRTVKEMDNVHLAVDFQQLIMGPVKGG